MTKVPMGNSVATVIIVVRNAKSALQKTLESIAAVGIGAISIVVIDGASNDGTADLLAAMDDQILFWCSEPDNGIYDAMNKGWAAAPMGSYIIYLGAGDILYEIPSESTLKQFREEGVGVILGHCDVGAISFDSRWSSEIMFRNVAHHQGMMVLKDVHPGPPFDTSLKIYGDWDFNIRLYKTGVPHRRNALRSFAEPGGVSWRHDLKEIIRVATRNGGVGVGVLSWLLNSLSRLRRDWKEMCRG